MKSSIENVKISSKSEKPSSKSEKPPSKPEKPPTLTKPKFKHFGFLTTPRASNEDGDFGTVNITVIIRGVPADSIDEFGDWVMDCINECDKVYEDVAGVLTYTISAKTGMPPSKVGADMYPVEQRKSYCMNDKELAARIAEVRKNNDTLLEYDYSYYKDMWEDTIAY